MTDELTPGTCSHFDQIRRVNDAGNEYWSSRDFARYLGYSDYRNFEAVVENARIACFNSGQRVVTISLKSPKWSPLAVAPSARPRPCLCRGMPASDAGNQKSNNP
jgi:hypothetical protein